MSMTCKERSVQATFIHAFQYALATLIQGIASALGQQLLEHASHRLNSIHQMIQLRKFSAGEFSPALRRARDVAETKEQVPDFIQRKTQLTRPLNDCQTVQHRGGITPLPTHPFRRRKQANLLVIANGGGPKSNLPCNLRNG